MATIYNFINFLCKFQVFVPLYLDESLEEDAESLATVPLCTFLASFVASLIVKNMNRGLGRMVSV